MNEPEINIDGDIDERKLKELLKGMRSAEPHKSHQLPHSHPKNEIDASELTLEPFTLDKSHNIMEPYSEVNDFDDFTEIIVEIPGMGIEDIVLTFSEGGSILTFLARNNKRKYLKEFNLPFESSLSDCIVDVNNGIATLLCRRSLS